MKKLIVLSVVFALVAGVAFAADVSANIETRIELIRGDTDSDSKPTIGHGAIGAAGIAFNGTNDDGTFGGTFTFRNVDLAALNPGGGMEAVGNFHRVFVWYKPFDFMRIFMGIDQDGRYGTGQFTDWPFHQGAEGFLHVHDWDLWRSFFPGNWDRYGLAFELYPVDGLNINLVIPTMSSGAWPRATNEKVSESKTWEDMFVGGLRLQANYAIPDIGAIYLSWIGPGSKFDDANNFGDLGVSFVLRAIDGLPMQIGFATALAKSVDDGGYDAPIRIGFATHFSGGDFGVKFRTGLTFGTGDDESSRIIGDIMPWYNFGKLTGFLCFGLDMRKTNADTDAVVNWWLNPYIRVPMGSANIRTGLLIQGDNGDDSVVSYKFPVLFGFSF